MIGLCCDGMLVAENSIARSHTETALLFENDVSRQGFRTILGYNSKRKDESYVKVEAMSIGGMDISAAFLTHCLATKKGFRYTTRNSTAVYTGDWSILLQGH